VQDTRKTRQVLSPSYTVAVGVQDGSFEAFRRGSARAIQYTSFCLTKVSGSFVHDIRLGCITVDGLDATDILLDKLDGWCYDVIILGGVTFAGFNVVDVEYLYKSTGVPVIVFLNREPDKDATLRALRKHFLDWETRWSRFEALGGFHELWLNDGPSVFFEVIGASRDFAEKVLREQAVNGRVPEAVRVANLVAKGVSLIFQDRVESRDVS
jgi:endonuclease V-like protein UPF0215 family